MRKKGLPKNKNLKAQGIRFLYKEMSLLVIMVKLCTGKLKTGAKIRQNLFTYIRMMNKEGSALIVDTMTPNVVVRVLDCGHIVYVVKMHYFFTKKFFTGFLVMMSK